MDISEKRSGAGKVKRRLDRQLSGLGFKRTKPTFWTRPNALTIEFVHLHLYTFAASFRVHCGTRTWDDPFEAIALNGPSSDGAPGNGFSFDTSESSQQQCAELISAYVHSQEPWFIDQRGQLDGAQSEASPHTRAALEQPFSAKVSQENQARTEKLLGLKR